MSSGLRHPHPCAPRRGLALLLAALAALCLAQSASAQAGSEAALKLRLVLTLSRFVQWPAPVVADQPLALCVGTRRGEVDPVFAAADGQSVGTRRVRLLKAGGSEGCDLLYLPSGADQAAALLRAQAQRPVLTVSDADGFLTRGGMVELVLVNDALRFDVNQTALRSAHLGLSSQALRLARHVQD